MQQATISATPGTVWREIPEEQSKTVSAVVQLMGTPGCGVTSLIERTVRRLGQRMQIGAIIAHAAAARDADTLVRAGARATAVESIAPDASALAEAIAAMPSHIELLLIESAEPDLRLGDMPLMRVAVLSVTGGDSKAVELARVLEQADLVLLTKADLLPYVKFDLDLFHNDVHRANPKAKLIELAHTDETGLTEWTDWLLSVVIQRHSRSDPKPEMPEWWFG